MEIEKIIKKSISILKDNNGILKLDDFKEKLENFKTQKEDGSGEFEINIKLCGENCTITFKEKHVFDLQQLLFRRINDQN